MSATRPCIVIGNAVHPCEDLITASCRDAIVTVREYGQVSGESRWRYRIGNDYRDENTMLVTHCPFCGASIVPPYTANESP
jgi:hypothetical protein